MSPQIGTLVAIPVLNQIGGNLNLLSFLDACLRLNSFLLPLRLVIERLQVLLNLGIRFLFKHRRKT